MNVLVTGAFGNIGSHSVDALLKLHHRVRALSLGAPDSRLTKAWGNKVEVVRGDVTRPETLPSVVRGVDRVVHLAYLIPPVCLEKPDEARKVNVDGTRNMLEAVK